MSNGIVKTGHVTTTPRSSITQKLRRARITSQNSVYRRVSCQPLTNYRDKAAYFIIKAKFI
jgi:hypothetical protein